MKILSGCGLLGIQEVFEGFGVVIVVERESLGGEVDDDWALILAVGSTNNRAILETYLKGEPHLRRRK